MAHFNSGDGGSWWSLGKDSEDKRKKERMNERKKEREQRERNRERDSEMGGCSVRLE